MAEQSTTRRLVVTAVLTMVIVNVIWLARLEAQAQQTSKLMDHHLSLDAKADVLSGLAAFERRVGQNRVTMDASDIVLSTHDPSGEDVYVGLDTSGLFQVGTKGGFHVLHLTPERFRVYLDGDELAIDRDGTVIMKVDDGPHSIRVSDSGVSAVTDEGKPTEAHLAMRTGGDFQATSFRGSHMYALNMSQSGGVSLKWDSTTISIDGKDGGAVRIKTDGDISLEAGGDLALKAPNGEVTVDGKRVDINR